MRNIPKNGRAYDVHEKSKSTDLFQIEVIEILRVVSDENNSR